MDIREIKAAAALMYPDAIETKLLLCWRIFDVADCDYLEPGRGN